MSFKSSVKGSEKMAKKNKKSKNKGPPGKSASKGKYVLAKDPKARARQNAAIKRYYVEKKHRKSDGSLLQVRLKMHNDLKGGHHHVILEDIDDKHVSVGLSSKNKKGRNSTNYACENDVIGNGKSDRSYLRRQGTVDFKNNYYDESIGHMTEKDLNQAKIYGERAKQKYLEKNKK